MSAEHHLQQLCQRLPHLQETAADLRRAHDLCAASLRHGGTLFLCGNGGSRADAEHIAGELLKGFLKRRGLSAGERAELSARFGAAGERLAAHLQGGLRAHVLGSESALSTAVANDTDAELIFAQPLLALARRGDVLLALSTSGGARNVLAAARVAAVRGVGVVSLTGAGGGELAGLAQVAIRVPAVETYLVQELHVSVYHCLCAMLEETFFSD